MGNVPLVLLVLLAACVPLPGAASGPSDDGLKKLESLKEEIEALNGNLSCFFDSDCVAIPQGHGGCGGPNDFLISSKRNKNIDQIREKAALRIKMSGEYSQKIRDSGGSGWGIADSPCVVPARPKFKCAWPKFECVNEGYERY